MDVFGLQMDIVWEDRAANHAAVAAVLAHADLPRGALLVLPEMFAAGYSMNVDAIHEGDDRPTERFIAQLAGRYDLTVIAGVVTRAEDGRGRNEAIVVGPGGQLARYTKRRPMPVSGEADAYIAGDRCVVVPCGETHVAPLICYDLRFPELFREAACREAPPASSAEVFVVIASFPAVRADHWRALLIARAIENQAYVVGVNRVGSDPNLDYAGGSLVIDPRGRVVAELDDQPALLHATLDLRALRKWRRDFPALLHQPPERDIKSP